ncbi:MAG: hypothetical protein IJ146_00820, partial [Kiritimatiellae bacterium]|nr:hypothetical protein [Kiritimatiellia bacterium]
VTGHEVCVTNRLSRGVFDSDGDGMLDWWEIAHGLSPTNSADALVDSDGDGLVSRLEYKYGFDPSVSDATNTLMSVISRSVDERIDGLLSTNRLDIYEDYAANGWNTNFTLSADCWAQTIDFSCCSMWNDCTASAFGPTTTPVTVISPRHVIYAAHFDYRLDESGPETMPLGKTYFFRGKSGTIYSRRMIAKTIVIDDIAIGLLDSELPTNDVAVAYVLTAEYSNYLGRGDYFPVVFVDQQERAYVGTSVAFPPAQSQLYIDWTYPMFNRREFRKTQGAIGGDSSSPKFFVVGDDLILLGVTHFGGTAGGAFVTRYIAKIERAMLQLLSSSAYGLRFFDFSPYQMVQEVPE